jgi:Flp pilus assembly protein TadD
VRERILIVVVALLAFSGSLWSPFFFDDYALQTDPVVTKPSGVLELAALERTRPLTYATFWANFRAAGFEPFGFHLVNLLLSAATVWLAGSVYQRVAGRTAAWIALAVFALHPLQTESVAYVFARATLLTTLLSLASWRAWLAGAHWRATAWFAAALLAKEEAAALPLFLAGFEWFHQRRREGWKVLAGPLAAMAALVVVSAVRLWHATRVIEGSGAGLDLGPITPWTYLLTQGRAIWLYLRLFVAPVGQSFDRDLSLTTSLDAANVAAWLGLVLLAGAALGFSRRWRPFWWLAGFFVLLAPTSSIAPLADLMAERRMFLPLVSLALFAGCAIERLAGRRAVAAGAAVALALAWASWRRTQVFSSEIALWSDAVSQAPAKVRPKLQLARALEAEGLSAVARRLQLLEEARALDANSEVLGEIGVFYLQTSDPARAEQVFRQAVEVDPHDPQLRTNLGTALAMQSRMDEAESAFRQALGIDACNFDARNNLIFALRRRGAAEEARSFAFAPPDCPFSRRQLEALDAVRGAP